MYVQTMWVSYLLCPVWNVYFMKYIRIYCIPWFIFFSFTILQLCATKKKNNNSKNAWDMGLGALALPQNNDENISFFIQGLCFRVPVYKSKHRQIIDRQKWILVRRSENEGKPSQFARSKRNRSVGNKLTQQLTYQRAQVVMLRPNKKQGSDLRDYRWVDW